MSVKLDTYENSKPNKASDTKGKKEFLANNLSGINRQKQWEHLRKVYDMVSFKIDDTDCEDDLEIRHRVPVGRSKKKSDKYVNLVFSFLLWFTLHSK